MTAAPTRILVVDDDEAFRESVCTAIARDDAMVLAAQAHWATGNPPTNAALKMTLDEFFTLRPRF